jgi:hypothetical protein
MKDKDEEPAPTPVSPEGRVVRVEAENGVAACVTIAGVVAPYRLGQDPPDVIEVVFPAGRAGSPSAVRTTPLAGPAPGSAESFAESPAGPFARPFARPFSEPFAEPLDGSRRERLRERPLVLGALAIAAVGLVAALAWLLWPQTAATAQPGPVSTASSSAQPPLADGLLPPLSSSTPTARTTPPARSASPSTTPAASAAPLLSPEPTSPAPTSSSSAGPSTATIPPAVPRTLRAGDSGPDVTELQQVLFEQGFTYVSPTGVYDDATVQGVTQAQHDRGLACDPVGVYGPCTRAALAS